MKMSSRLQFLRTTGILLTFCMILLSQGISAVTEEQGVEKESKQISRADLYIRDPFILPEAAAKRYYLYKSVGVHLSNGKSHRGVCAYISKDLQMWDGPIPVSYFLDGFWADQSIWAPEVHKYKGEYVFMS